jgi:hypothetical protein
MRKHNADTAKSGRRCGHGWCTDCQTRRGRNRGNRNARHAARALLSALRKDRGESA